MAPIEPSVKLAIKASTSLSPPMKHWLGPTAIMDYEEIQVTQHNNTIMICLTSYGNKNNSWNKHQTRNYCQTN